MIFHALLVKKQLRPAGGRSHRSARPACGIASADDGWPGRLWRGSFLPARRPGPAPMGQASEAGGGQAENKNSVVAGYPRIK